MEIRSDTQDLVQNLAAGMIFILPTDTIYGLSCDATNEEAVATIRRLKNRPEAPLSVWAPSKEWIRTNCVVEEEDLAKLPGAYTLIVRLKNTNAVAKNVCEDTIGVRMPDHWLADSIEKFGKPVITTSVNKSGEPFMTCQEDLDKDVAQGVDVMIDEGVKEVRPSIVLKDGKRLR